MNEIKIFENEQFGKVRIAMNESNEPLFCLADVCKILDLGNPSQVKLRLSDGVISNEGIPDSLGRIQQANFVNEDGLYDVILDSRKPEAKQFRKWVTSEVLPSIRKNGGYIANQENLSPEEIVANALVVAQRIIDNQKKELANAKPKVEFFDTVTGSKDTIDMRTVATVLNCGLGRNKIFEILRDKKILDRKNIPYQSYIDSGYFRTIESTYTKPDGDTCINIKTVIFQKGLDFIRKVIKSK